MKQKQAATFRNSALDRAAVPNHRFHSFINQKLKRHPSTTGLVEDRTSSTAIVRIICALLLIHLLIIGGVLLRGHLLKSNAGIAVAPTMTPPPAAPATAAIEQPGDVPTVNMSVAPVVNPEAAIAPAAPAVADTHITQLPTEAAPAAPVATAAPAAPVVEAAPATPATPAAPAAAESKVLVKHFIKSGESWSGIARKYSTTIAELKKCNPKAAAKANLIAGTYIDVPVAADSAQGQAAAAARQAKAEEARGKVYVVQRGDSLGKIAKKNKTSIDKIRRLNGLTPADDRRIRPGMELKVAE